MKVVILFLAAALGSASPVPTQNSIQARNGQNACDCAEPWQVDALAPDYKICPDGYEKVYRLGLLPSCDQIGCSYGEHKAKCSNNKPATTATAKPQDTSSTAVDKPAATEIAPEELNACDCAEPWEVSASLGDNGTICPDGYEKLRFVALRPACGQISCSAEEHEAKCDAKAEDATPSTAVNRPATTATAKPGETSLSITSTIARPETTNGATNTKLYISRPGDDQFYEKGCSSHDLRFTETCLGTLRYCNQKHYEQAGEAFSSSEACMSSREPPPFQDPPASEYIQEDVCGNARTERSSFATEECLGTVEYCNRGLYDQMGESFATPEECIASRRKRTAVDKPATTATAKPQDTPSAAAGKPAATAIAPEEQNACDCAEPWQVSALGPDYKICPDGYEKVYRLGLLPSCDQIGCSYGEHKAKCSNNKPGTFKSDWQAPTQIEKACHIATVVPDKGE